MYISIETQRFLGSKFFEWDIEMYDEAMNIPAKANNSEINEDLGQVEYLFTDKTGTLTENEMIFKQFFLNGRVYKFSAAENTILTTDTNDPYPVHVKSITNSRI